MSTMQIRGVPESVSRTLKGRAAAAGMSLSEYLLAEVTKIAERPSLAELTDRLERRPVRALPAVADVLRHERRDDA
ncbi:hypothetical protein N802_07705 [Knoellia sinensis KCTC 19936]|uniref:Antitoxin n=1 Tax=Knoellia sinensis KCTC 19936 TaxID=1385520 RepID=A0A0A0J959_9MICO|nr:hypothetical protein [Knoellia sinensis]KGN33693.1 hypothetical protein N802_07705 [Knoellia sinensis KCTC 19936]